MEIRGSSDDALSFLKKILPLGPWVLTAIGVDRKVLRTETYYPGEEAEARVWIDKYNGEMNIYWHVNPVMRRLKKKAEREDIKEVVQFHVDIDPRVGEDIQSEQDRALNLLKNPPKGVPRPTTVIFSGGGYQAFWRLREPIPIEGSLDAAEDAKLYNIQIERIFGADNCHNIDRLCRLVGSVNIPDAKKKKKGRKPTVSTLVWHDEEAVYDITQFAKATVVQMQGEKGFTGVNNVKISGNIKRIEVDELDEWNVPERVKVIIVQGHHPDEPKEGDNSRSAWVFDCICQLVRSGVPDEVIYAIITDSDFGISSSIIDKGTNAEKYAIRQIERAKEFIIDPALRELNERHAVIENVGGKCRIVEEIFDEVMGRTRLTKQSFEDFRNRYMHRKVKIGSDKEGQPIYSPLGKWWLQNPLRRQYRTIVFAPNREVTDAYNLWRGFSCEPKEGDCSLFLEHLKKNICSGNEEHYGYLISWMANAVQKPDGVGQVAVVLRSGMGTGKGFFVRHFGSLFGRHFIQVADAKHLVGNFNSHLRDCVVLFGDEAFFAGDKRHEGILRMLVTEETLIVESKGVDAETSPNFIHLVLASNNNWVIPAGADERRFFVLDVNEDHKQDIAYFAKIDNQMKNGGNQALLYFLLNHDIKNFEVRIAPKTEALQDQKMLSMSPEQEWFFTKLQEGRLLPEHDSWEQTIIKEDLFTDYIEYMRSINHFRRANKTIFGKFMGDICSEKGKSSELQSFQQTVNMQVPTGNGFFKEVRRRPYFYKFPSLTRTRELWCKKFGSHKWEEIEGVQSDLLKEEEIPF